MEPNKKLYWKGRQGILNQSDRGRTHCYLEKLGMVYLDRNVCIVKNTSNNIAHDAVKMNCTKVYGFFNNNKHNYLC